MNDDIYDELKRTHATPADGVNWDAVVAHAMCRMAEIQQTQYEEQKEARRRSEEAFREMAEDLDSLFDGDDDGRSSDDFRYDP